MGRRTTVAVLMGAMVTATALVVGGAPTAQSAQSDRSTQKQTQVVVDDITIAVPGQDPVQAWLVRPAGQPKKHSLAGVLWLHWLGEINGDRSEYLSEAVTLAGKGVVSVLPQGFFPWVRTPTARPATSPWSRTRWPPCEPPSTGSSPSGPSTPRASPWSGTTTAPCTARCSPTPTNASP